MIPLANSPEARYRVKINTSYDVEARYSIKRSTTWTGYKVHLTETCVEETPPLITQVLTTPAATPDFHAPAVIHSDLAAMAETNGLPDSGSMKYRGK